MIYLLKHKVLVAGAVFASALVGGIMGFAGDGRAESNIVFILDASNSMRGTVGGETKMSVAQRVLGDLLADLPEGTRVGLMAYGHTVHKDDPQACTDIQPLSEIGADEPATLIEKIRQLQPMGRTPIADALGMSVGAFQAHQGENNHVVLISDGVETCQGDPCASAKLLADSSIGAKVHVIGFAVSDEERAQLRCISELGGGRFFSANNAEELKLAVAEVKEVAEAEPTFREVFRDDFDGEDLADHWQVVNPDPDGFIVEEGQLLLVGSAPEGFADPNKSNIMQLTATLPKGDWVATMTLNVEFNTDREQFVFGLYDSPENYIAMVMSLGGSFSGQTGALYTQLMKRTKANLTPSTAQIIFPRSGSVSLEQYVTEHLKQPIQLRVSASGRRVVFEVRFGDQADAEGKAVWHERGYLTTLRAPKGLAMTGGQLEAGVGETLYLVDSVTIEVPETETADQ